MAKLKVLLYYPEWGNRWIPYFKNILSKRYELRIVSGAAHDLPGEKLGPVSEWADVLFSTWCSEVTNFWTHYFPDKKIISYLRRYELWTGDYQQSIKYENIDALIFVSPWCQEAFHRIDHGEDPKREYVIYNGINVNQFPFKYKRETTKRLAFVCSLKHVKNVPLAVQILLNLPEEYQIWHVGIPFSDQFTGQLISYVHHLGLFNTRFNFGGLRPSSQMIDWYMDKDSLLSTSVNEGNPMNIMEAMAMGIKPIIHDWPGAREQFPEDHIFRTVDEATNIIQNHMGWKPQEYRAWVADKFPMSNYEQIYDVIEEVMSSA
jgi:glycosyltransferase involved in cell wall biosynthesis